MSDLLQTGVDWLSGQMQSYGSRSVVYASGGDTVTIDATPGQGDYEYTASDGSVISVQPRDFIFPAADLDFGVGAVEPVPGDTITETVNGAAITWEVMPLAGSLPCFRYSDRGRVTLRVHCKRVAVT